MANFKDLALLKGADENNYLAILPTSIAHVGDIAVIDGDLYEIQQTAWIDTTADTYAMLTAAYTLLTPEKVLHLKWEKDETAHADS